MNVTFQLLPLSNDCHCNRFSISSPCGIPGNRLQFMRSDKLGYNVSICENNFVNLYIIEKSARSKGAAIR